MGFEFYDWIEDVIELEVIPILGDFVEDFDLEGIAREITETVQTFNDDGIATSNPRMKVRELTQEELNEILMRHDISASK